jgi:Rod binding domain-containing protein
MSETRITPTTIYTGISTSKELKSKEIQNKPQIDDKQYIPSRYKEVAANMEQQFVEMMLDQMGKTIDEANPEENNAGMEYYKSLQKSERAKSMTMQNNLGLQDMILNQIYPKRLRNEMALKSYEQQTNQVHHNLPSYKIEQKNDKIDMGKNDSTPVSEPKNVLGPNEIDGGLL